MTANMVSSSFSPRNGEIILKTGSSLIVIQKPRFSPRNGEIILKAERSTTRPREGRVSVPAMGR